MPNAAAPQPIQVLKAGVHVDSNGTRVEFSESDLQAIADGYNRTLHEAPFVVGHPTMDAPAYGWATKFFVRDGVLFAEGDQVEEQFAGLVKEGRFKKVSMSLYGPKAPGNPKPGIWYPRHIGFLGGMPPAIKGLASVQFGEGETGVHEFSDAYVTGSVIRLLRGMRDWMLAQFGQDTADKVLPSSELDYAAESLAAERVREAMTEGEGITPAFSEGPTTGAGADDMSTEKLAALQAQVDAERARAEKAEADLKARQQADQEAADRQRNDLAVAFAEQAVAKGLVPAERRDNLAALHLRLSTPDATGQVLQFGEGDKAVTAAAELEALVALIKPSVEFGELASRNGRSDVDADDHIAQVQFAEGTHLDPERLALHHAALDYQRKAKAKGEPVDYQTALNAVK